MGVINVKKYLWITTNLCVIREMFTQTENIVLFVQNLSVIKQILSITCGMFIGRKDRFIYVVIVERYCLRRKHCYHMEEGVLQQKRGGKA